MDRLSYLYFLQGKGAMSTYWLVGKLVSSDKTRKAKTEKLLDFSEALASK